MAPPPPDLAEITFTPKNTSGIPFAEREQVFFHDGMGGNTGSFTFDGFSEPIGSITIGDVQGEVWVGLVTYTPAPTTGPEPIQEIPLSVDLLAGPGATADFDFIPGKLRAKVKFDDLLVDLEDFTAVAQLFDPDDVNPLIDPEVFGGDAVCMPQVALDSADDGNCWVIDFPNPPVNPPPPADPIFAGGFEVTIAYLNDPDFPIPLEELNPQMGWDEGGGFEFNITTSVSLDADPLDDPRVRGRRDKFSSALIIHQPPVCEARFWPLLFDGRRHFRGWPLLVVVKCVDMNGELLTDAPARLGVDRLLNDGSRETQVVTSWRNVNEENLFDVAHQRYFYWLSTRGYSKGWYELTVSSPAFAPINVEIKLIRRFGH